MNAKLSKSTEAKTSWDNFIKESDKEKIRPAWNDLKTKLSNLMNVENNRNKDDGIDEKKIR